MNNHENVGAKSNDKDLGFVGDAWNREDEKFPRRKMAEKKRRYAGLKRFRV